jgi:hypothetical protein
VVFSGITQQWVCSINKQKMNFLHATFLAKHPQGTNDNLCFTLVLIQIIIDVITLDCRPYVHNEHCYTSFEKFFQSKLENKDARWNVSFSILGQRPNILNNLEVCCYENHSSPK